MVLGLLVRAPADSDSTAQSEIDLHGGTGAMTERERALEPEDLARLFVERANAGDAEGLAELYEPDAGLGLPPGQQTAGPDAIGAVCEKLVSSGLHFEVEEPLPTLRAGDLALTSTRPADNTGGRVQ